MATQPNPAKSYLALYPETAPGFVDFSHRHDMDFNGREKFTPNGSLLPRTIISGKAERQAGLTGKNQPTGGFGQDALNPMCADFLLGNFFGSCSDPIEVIADKVYRTTYSLTESNSLDRGIAASIYRDDQIVEFAYGCVVNQFVVGAKARGLMDVDFSMLPTYLDYWDNHGSAITGTGVVKPVVRGFCDQNYHVFNPVRSAGDLYVKIVTNSSSLITAFVKVGAATAYGTDAQTFYKGFWNECTDQDGGSIGFRLEINPPTGTYVVDDVIVIPCRRESVWAGYTAPDDLPLSEVTSTIVIPSYPASQGRLQNVTLTAKSPAKQIDGIGGLWPAGILKQGVYTYELSYDIDVLDDTTRAYIEMKRPYSVILDYRAEAVIADTNIRPRMVVTMDNIIGSGSTATIADQNTYKDSVKAEGFLPSPACSIEIWNGNSNPTDS